MVSRYHIGPQEKMLTPKYSDVWGSPSRKPASTFSLSATALGQEPKKWWCKNRCSPAVASAV